MNNIQPGSGEGVSQISVRVPVSLHKQIKGIAQERGQSVNTMIVMTMRKEAEATAQK